MVLAEDIEILSRFTAADLTDLIRLTGYKGDKFLTAKFVGITNSGHFCYTVTYKGEDQCIERTKVFVDQCPDTGATRVEY